MFPHNTQTDTMLYRVSDEPWMVRFAVKFYPPEPAQLQEELTRYQLVLAVRKDLLEGAYDSVTSTFNQHFQYEDILEEESRQSWLYLIYQLSHFSLLVLYTVSPLEKDQQDQQSLKCAPTFNVLSLYSCGTTIATKNWSSIAKGRKTFRGNFRNYIL